MSGIEPNAAPVVPDLSCPRRIHVVAAGGAGMSSIATVLSEQGHRVSGSDQVDSAVLRRLSLKGVEVHVGHDRRNVEHCDLVVISTAVGETNPEVVAARERGVPVLRRIDLLPALAVRQPFLAVSGTHGKTTTTSMLATALVAAGQDPSFLIGADVRALGGSGAHGSGRWFVVEADESDGSFMAGPRAAAVVTNVEPDHLEFWGGWDELRSGFTQFLQETDGPGVVCGDDPEASAIGATVGAVTYGTVESATYRIEDLMLGPTGSTWTLMSPGGAARVGVGVPGLHNALNATAALAVVGELGVDMGAAAGGLRSFDGAARRFERRGSIGGIDFVDDYAHLPTEVRAALAAGRSGGWQRVVAVFQPHRYSRTEALWADFAESFQDADVLLLSDIYPAGEEARPGVSGELLVQAVRSFDPSTDLRWCPTLDDVVDALVAELQPGDLCMTIGAGDVTTVADRVVGRLERAEG